MGLGLAWLLAATLLLVVRPELLSLPHAHPGVVALTHAWVLGFFVTVACGAVYQLAPVALGTTLWRPRLAWWHFGLHALGVPGMVVAFWRWDLALLGHIGFAVAIGVVLFSLNTWRTVRRSGRRGTVSTSLMLAASWILLTVLLGLTLAANRFWDFLPLTPLALLRAHAHVGLIGFFVTLLQGVSFQLVPMFTLGTVRDWRLPNRGLWLTQAGLLLLAPALAWQLPLVGTLGAIAILAGLSCSGVGLVRTLATRKKRALDPGLHAFLRGGAGLVVTAIAGLALVAPGTPWGSAPGGFNAMVYAVLGLFGGLLPCVAGLLCKIIPFLTWMRAYGPRVGRGRTPTAGALIHPRVQHTALALQNLAVLPLLVGTWTQDVAWLRAGAWLFAAGIGVFVAEMLSVLKHLWVARDAAVASQVKAKARAAS